MKMKILFGMILIISFEFAWANTVECLKNYENSQFNKKSIFSVQVSERKKMEDWNKNYKSLLGIFLNNKEVKKLTLNEYEFFLSGAGDPADSDAFQLQIWKKEATQPIGFEMYSPKKHHGEIQVELSQNGTNRVFTYRQSDSIGWIILQLEINAAGELVAAKLFKTLPYDGEGNYKVYDTALDIKKEP